MSDALNMPFIVWNCIADDINDENNRVKKQNTKQEANKILSDMKKGK